jgi:hypothetical protein
VNAARLARRLDEAGDDRVRWAEAICEEVTDPNTGLVTKDYLDRRLAEFETRFAEMKVEFADFRTKLTRDMLFAQVTGFIAIAILILLRQGIH